MVEKFLSSRHSFYKSQDKRLCSLTINVMILRNDNPDTQYHLSKAGFIQKKIKVWILLDLTFLLGKYQVAKIWTKMLFACVKDAFLLSGSPIALSKAFGLGGPIFWSIVGSRQVGAKNAFCLEDIDAGSSGCWWCFHIGWFGCSSR